MITNKNREAQKAREFLAEKGLKHCSRCEKVKDIKEFTKHVRKSDGLDPWCRACIKIENDLKNPRNNARFYGSRPEDHEFPPGPVSYKNAHQRPRAVYGHPYDYPCIGAGCDHQAQDWAYQGGCPNEQSGERVDGRTGNSRIFHWTRDHTYYAPMCRSCHTKMDKAEAKLRQVS